jgi:HSP20 family protein
MALPTRVNRGTGYDPFELAQREFDNMLGRFLGGYGGRTAEAHAALAPYGVDVREDADHIYVEAELPGFRKEDVDITLENNTLTITAERSEEHSNGRPGNGGGGNAGGQPAQAGARPQAGQIQQRPGGPQGNWLLRERRYNRFQRSFTLPDSVDEQTVNAKLNDGVLTITLNKREEVKPRKISVS